METSQIQLQKETTRKHPLLLTSSALTILLLAMFSISMSATAQHGNFEELQHDTHEVMESLGDYTAQQRDAVVSEVNQSLTQLDRYTERMQERIDANMQVMSIESQELARDAMEKLREQRAVVNVHLEQLANNTTDTWDEVKDGFVEAYEQMYEAWEKTEQSLTESS